MPHEDILSSTAAMMAKQALAQARKGETEQNQVAYQPDLSKLD